MNGRNKVEYGFDISNIYNYILLSFNVSLMYAGPCGISFLLYSDTWNPHNHAHVVGDEIEP